MFTDDDFLKHFEDCSLEKCEFTHEAHVRMAWIYLKHFPFEQASNLIRDGIKRFNQSKGNSTGYHETVTQAFAYIIHDAIQKHPSMSSWHEFRSLHSHFLDRTNPILLKYYQKETLDQPQSRLEFIDADVQPLPTVRGKDV